MSFATRLLFGSVISVSSSITGVQGASALGSVSVTTNSTVTVGVSGVSATGVAGSVSVAAAGNITVGLSGVSATGRVGTATASVINSVTASATGNSAVGIVGAASVATTTNVTVAVTGRVGTTSVGTVTPRAGVTTFASGVAGTTALGSVTVVIPPVIAITNQNIYDSNIGGAISYYQLENTGKVYGITTTAGSTLLEYWATGAFTASNYEAVVSLVSGTLTGGTVGSAVNLGTTQNWYVQVAGVGYKSCTFNIIIRPAGGGTTITSAQIVITAQGF